MSLKTVIAELAHIDQASSGKTYRDRTHVCEADIQRWSELIAEPRAVLYDRIAAYLARGFHHHELEFEFCDATLNDIHGVITMAGEDRPELFWQIYLAFDEGEYYHGNRRDVDPVEIYTRPQIAKIVESLPIPN